MEENLKNQLENTFSTCRRSPRILERENRQTPSTVIKPYFGSDKTILADNSEQDNAKEILSIGNSPEGNLYKTIINIS